MVSHTRVLAYYDLTKPTSVSADASSYGIGGVIMQDQGNGRMKPIAFCSRILNLLKNAMHRLRKSVWLVYGHVRNSTGSFVV